jgi:hypothetical protein
MEDKFRVNFKGIACDVLDSAQEAQSRVQSQALLNITIYLPACARILL